jgi:uncharacterized protein (DUF433 family)
MLATALWRGIAVVSVAAWTREEILREYPYLEADEISKACPTA